MVTVRTADAPPGPGPEPAGATRASGQQPRLSVVIASVNGPQYVAGFLQSLGADPRQNGVEIVIADRYGDAVAETVQRHCPGAVLLRFSERKSVPELRALALKSARGEIIAVTEDHCVPSSDWCQRILAAHQQHYGVIGGAVENHPDTGSLVDWAAYFCEYSRFMSPVPAGESDSIPGNNLSYRREFLPHIADMLDAGCFWEESLLARLREKGIRCFSDPSIIVYHRKSFGFGYFLGQRYQYSRAFAGMRLQGASGTRRALYALGSALLPALLLFRITRNVLAKRRHLGRFIMVQPLLWVFLLGWAGGEFVGCLLGSGGSLLKVE